MEVKLILPATSGGPISDGLVELTKRVCEVTGAEAGGGLGGRFGYGANYENETFMMHRYCWCEQASCQWCVGCECGDDFDTNPCAYCRDEVRAAPNFLHKPTGSTVHWYKYIGRGMEVSDADWPAIIAECIASLTPTNAGGEAE